jgi:acyl-coenzyme A thioesterase PaaI-like protein
MVVVIQNLVRDNVCWGCGADNPDGLQLKSTWDGTRAVATWSPQPRFAAGPPHVLNGGIIATLIDCHGVCTAMADAYDQAGRVIGDAPELWFATSSLSVDYLRPTGLAEPVTLSAHVTQRAHRVTTVECTLSSAGKLRASAVVQATMVGAKWRHGAAPPARQ